jgi:hypothetical protein
LQTEDTCALCDQESETITHLLVGCSFNKELWGLESRMTVGNEQCVAQWWSAARRGLAKAGRKAMDSLVVLVC